LIVHFYNNDDSNDNNDNNNIQKIKNSSKNKNKKSSNNKCNEFIENKAINRTYNKKYSNINNSSVSLNVDNSFSSNIIAVKKKRVSSDVGKATKTISANPALILSPTRKGLLKTTQNNDAIKPPRKKIYNNILIEGNIIYYWLKNYFDYCN